MLKMNLLESLKKMFKGILCVCMLVTGFIMNPITIEAALKEPDAEVEVLSVPVIVTDKIVDVTVKDADYASNKFRIKLNGTYTHNATNTSLTLSNVNMTVTYDKAITFVNSYTGGDGIYHVVGFTITRYEATEDPFKVIIHYRSDLRLLSGEILGYSYGSKTVTFTN